MSCKQCSDRMYLLTLREEDVHLHCLEILYRDRITLLILGLSGRKFHKHSFGDDQSAEGNSESGGFRLESWMVPFPFGKATLSAAWH